MCWPNPVPGTKQFSLAQLRYCSGIYSHFSKDNFLTIASVTVIPGDGLTSFEGGSATLD